MKPDAIPADSATRDHKLPSDAMCGGEKYTHQNVPLLKLRWIEAGALSV